MLKLRFEKALHPQGLRHALTITNHYQSLHLHSASAYDLYLKLPIYKILIAL